MRITKSQLQHDLKYKDSVIESLMNDLASLYLVLNQERVNKALTDEERAGTIRVRNHWDLESFLKAQYYKAMFP